MPEDEKAEIIDGVWSSDDKQPSAPAQKKQAPKKEEPVVDNAESPDIVVASLQRQIGNIQTKVNALRNKESYTKGEIDALRKKIYKEEQNILELGKSINDDEELVDEYESDIKRLNEKIIEMKKMMTQLENLL